MRVVLELNNQMVTNIVADGALDLYVVEHREELGDEQVLITQYQVSSQEETMFDDVAYIEEIESLWKEGQDVALRSN